MGVSQPHSFYIFRYLATLFDKEEVDINRPWDDLDPNHPLAGTSGF